MRDNDLRARQKRRFKLTTESEHAWPVAPNIIDKDFTATDTNDKRGVDTIDLARQHTLDCRGVDRFYAGLEPGFARSACMIPFLLVKR